MMNRKYNIAIITVSDRSFLGITKDSSGEFLKTCFDKKKYLVSYYIIIPDDPEKIEKTCLHLSDVLLYDLVILTGGTGLSEQDVTPETLKNVIIKEIPGIQIVLIANSLKYTKFAPLSRLVSGIRNKTLFISLPGSVQACIECMEIINPLLEHALNIIQNNKDSIHSKNFDDKDQQSILNLKEIDLNNVYENLVENKVEVNSAITTIFENLKKRYKLTKKINVNDDNIIGYYTVNTVYSEMNLPPFRASLKDGYAIKTCEKSVLKETMANPIHAGINICNFDKLKPDFCYRISTGAWVPDEVDAVVQIEDTKISKKLNDDNYLIEFKKLAEKNENIKEIGSDVTIGDLILKKNTVLNPENLGLLASVGLNQIEVYEKPLIGIFSTGDELINVDEQFSLPHIYDANRKILKSLLLRENFYVRDFGIAKDEIESIYMKIKLVLNKCDILITSGSISVGQKDYLKMILLKGFNATIHFSRINMKPGMPFTFANFNYNSKIKYIFALPGNPVSTYVTTKLFVLPALNYYCGCKFTKDLNLDEYGLKDIHKIIKVKLSSKKDFEKFGSDGRPEFVRCKIDFEYTIDGYPVAFLVNKDQKSSKLLSIQNANGLIIIYKNEFNNNDVFSAILIN